MDPADAFTSRLTQRSPVWIALLKLPFALLLCFCNVAHVALQLLQPSRPREDSMGQPMMDEVPMMDLDTPSSDELYRIANTWFQAARVRSGQRIGRRSGFKFFTKNATFLPHVARGTLQVNASGIDKVTRDALLMHNGESVPCDVLLLNTGYQDRFDFLSEPYAVPGNDVRNLYKHVFHPEALDGTLAFIGWVRPASGGIPACSELAARYFALLLSGKRRLPSSEALAREIADDKAHEEEMFIGSPDIKTVVDFISWADGMANRVGCEPQLWRMCFTPWRWRLLFKCVVGSCNPAQFRLRGPHSRPEAATALLFSLPIGFSATQIFANALFGLPGFLLSSRFAFFRHPTSKSYLRD